MSIFICVRVILYGKNALFVRTAARDLQTKNVSFLGDGIILVNGGPISERLLHCKTRCDLQECLVFNLSRNVTTWALCDYPNKQALLEMVALDEDHATSELSTS